MWEEMIYFVQINCSVGLLTVKNKDFGLLRGVNHRVIDLSLCY